MLERAGETEVTGMSPGNSAVWKSQRAEMLVWVKIVMIAVLHSAKSDCVGYSIVDTDGLPHSS